jgi:hypothetical protein
VREQGRDIARSRMQYIAMMAISISTDPSSV